MNQINNYYGYAQCSCGYCEQILDNFSSYNEEENFSYTYVDWKAQESMDALYVNHLCKCNTWRELSGLETVPSEEDSSIINNPPSEPQVFIFEYLEHV